MIASAPIPAVAYLRRSTDKQEQSLADQRREIQQYALENRFDIIREYVDDAISGTTTRKRPGFQQMIQAAERGEFAAILVWSSDRFSRAGLRETEHYLFLLEQRGVTLHSVTENYLNQDDMASDVLRAFKQSMNKQYSVSLSQNTLRGQLSSVQSASDPGRMPPFGYDREIVGPDGTVIHRVRFEPGGDRLVLAPSGSVQATYTKGQELLKPGKQCKARLVLGEPQRIQVIRDIFTWCCDGTGFKQIAARLNGAGIMSPRGRVWAHTTIKSIIENPTYRGDLVWNRRTMGKFHEITGGRIDKTKPLARSGGVEHKAKEQWITVPGAVPAIVTPEVWRQAQHAATERASRCGGGGKQDTRWLLSGVLKCGHCGSLFWGFNKTKSRKLGKKVIQTPYYCCAGRLRSGKSFCPHTCHLNANEVEATVLAKLKEMVFADSDCVQEAIERFVAHAMNESGGSDGTAAAQAELKQIEQRIKILITGLDPENLSLVNEQLTILRKRKEYLQEQIRLGSGKRRDERMLRAYATERIGVLADILRGRRDERSRQVVASYISWVVVSPESRQLLIQSTPFLGA